MIFIAVSTGHFDPLIEVCNTLSSRYEFFGQVGSSSIRPNFKHVKTLSPEKLLGHMAQSELVITHAGTGMLSMIYGLRKKSIVIPKQKCYGEANDGQVELAHQWARLGIATLCMDVRSLEQAIEDCRCQTHVFPDFPKLGHSLSQAMVQKKEPQLILKPEY